MTEESKEKIVATIMKCLELSREDNNGTEAERATAKEMAERLMAKYAIDFVDLRNGKPNDSVFVTFTVEGSAEEKVDFESALANGIAKAFDCKMINDWKLDGFRYQWMLSFCGTKHDLEIVVYFFKYLRRTLYAMAQKNVTKETVNGNGRTRITTSYIEEARRNYCLGMVRTINERLTELYAKREEFIPSDSRALVVVKKKGVEDYYHQQFPNIRNSRRKTMKGDIGAYYKGAEDGRNISLSRPIEGNGHANTQIA